MDSYVVDAYKRQRKRILNYVNDMKHRGYDTRDVSIPKIPKIITEASVRNLQRITPKKLRQQMYYISNTGEYARATNRVAVARLRKEELSDLVSRTTIDNFLTEVKYMDSDRAYDIVSEWLAKWVATEGEEFVAESLEAMARKGEKFKITEYDSWRRMQDKTIRYLKQTMQLSGEYSMEHIEEIETLVMGEIGGY